MRRFSVKATTLLAFFLFSCGTKKAGDKIVPLAGSSAGVKPSSSGDANSGGSGSNGGATNTPTGGTCKPAFSFAEAQQRCTACHSASGGNAKWAKADGTQDDWKAFASAIRASVDSNRMPMPPLEPNDKEKFIAFIDGLTGSCTPEANNAGGGNVPPPSPDIMSLAEAKAQCAGCHVSGGSGASVWDKANGSEADWRAFASVARSSVAANRMPPPNGMPDPAKTRMIAFLDSLLGGQANQPVTYTFETAKTLCVGCHSQSAPARAREEPFLDSRSQWVGEKKDIYDEVNRGRMPRGKSLSAEERQALLDFIDSL